MGRWRMKDEQAKQSKPSIAHYLFSIPSQLFRALWENCYISTTYNKKTGIILLSLHLARLGLRRYYAGLGWPRLSLASSARRCQFSHNCALCSVSLASYEPWSLLRELSSHHGLLRAATNIPYAPPCAHVPLNTRGHHSNTATPAFGGCAARGPLVRGKLTTTMPCDYSEFTLEHLSA